MTSLDPRLGAAAAITVAVFITASALWAAKTSGPLHQCPGRHEARHRQLEQEKAILAKLDHHEQQLTGYEKFFLILGLSGSSRRHGLHLIQGEQQDEEDRGRRAGLLTG